MSKFATVNGLITFSNRIIAYQQNPNLFLIVTDARRNFEAADHATFDKLVYDNAASNVERRYVDSLKNFFDPKIRTNDFLSGKDTLEGFGIEFTAEELAVSATIASIKAKIEAAFKLPEIPYINSAAIDVRSIYGDRADLAQRWLAGDATLTTHEISRLGSVGGSNWRTRNLMRIRTMPAGGVRIQLLSGREMFESVAKRLWAKLKPRWEAYNTDPSSINAIYGKYIGYQGGQHEIRIYSDGVKIGCQAFPRAEVERIAAERGW